MTAPNSNSQNNGCHNNHCNTTMTCHKRMNTTDTQIHSISKIRSRRFEPSMRHTRLFFFFSKFLHLHLPYHSKAQLDSTVFQAAPRPTPSYSVHIRFP
jgi:hypothetical protein